MKTHLQNILIKINQQSDLILACLIIAIIALMVLPLPTFMIDSLIALNLAFAITLLLTSLYLPSALWLSTFPTLLLFTTLFRLALNITTTRQILLYVDGGKIIETFGNLVVAGNYIVGSIIFLIVTLVQFMVIAKGSERVAEVAARFTLDAMPGKQMSIDADLRAGAIDMDAARKKRGELEKESQLYGSMDGAMKFVKGDAVAGLIVTAINILGGIVVGILQKKMSAMEALETYAILTIGDGLISQIPALLISVTAGIIVTRVAGDDSQHLGGDIGSQIMAFPKVFKIATGILICFALIPGFPTIQFLILAGASSIVGWRFFSQKEGQGAGADDDQEPESEQASGWTPTHPLTLVLPKRLRNTLNIATLRAEMKETCLCATRDLGVPFPFAKLTFAEGSSLKVLVHEATLVEAEWPEGHVLCLDALAEEDANMAPDFELNEGAAYWLEANDVAATDALRGEAIPCRLLYTCLLRHGAEFLGLEESRSLLDLMEAQNPTLVKETVRVLPLPKINEVLQRLVEEGVSIRNMRQILESIIIWAPREKDTVMLVEYVRSSLSRYISEKYRDGNALRAFILDPRLEEKIRGSIRQTSGRGYLALQPDVTRRIIQAVRAEWEKAQGKRPVLVSAMDIRRYLRKLLENDLKHLPVLSFQELSPGLQLDALGQIKLSA